MTMKNHDDAHDVYHWTQLGLGLCAAWVAVMVGLMLLISGGDLQSDGMAKPLQIAAQTVVPVGAAPARATPGGDSAGNFHGAPFVTDTGGSAPGPLQQ
jgi:hypothetical protein